MGGSGSKEPPSIPELLDKPWRTLDWGKRKKNKDELRSLKVSTSEVKYLRILVYGPVGSGKSSFINSIDSIFQERMTRLAAPVSGDYSVTTKINTHYIKDQSYESFVPFALCDTMGMEPGDSKGVHTDDLNKILEGHIKDSFQFNPKSPCSENDPHYNGNPELNDKIHCLVCVISTDRISMMPDTIVSKIKRVKDQAKTLKIPHVTVLTKVDETCPLVAQDPRLIYRSKKIREKVQQCSNKLGIPMNSIFPVRNYHEETDLNDEVDVLLLHALKHIVYGANDHTAAMTHPTLIGDKSTQNPLPTLGQRENMQRVNLQKPLKAICN